MNDPAASAPAQDVNWILKRHAKVREPALAASRQGATLSMLLIGAWKLWAPNENDLGPPEITAVIVLLASVAASSQISIVDRSAPGGCAPKRGRVRSDALVPARGR